MLVRVTGGNGLTELGHVQPVLTSRIQLNRIARKQQKRLFRVLIPDGGLQLLQRLA